MQTAKVIPHSIFANILEDLDSAKASGDLVKIWWVLDDLAGRALRAPNWHERLQAGRELEKHRAVYRTDECTDRFGDLAIIWGLPKAKRGVTRKMMYSTGPDAVDLHK